jgi:DNA repair exonuclease SbcCD ATPase subunit
MRFVSFKLLAACILLPPVLYILTIYGLERRSQEKFSSEIEKIYLGDTRRLLDGSVGIKNAIKANIEQYFVSQPLTRAGLSVRVTVVTKTGRVLYPSFFESDPEAAALPDAMAVATENFGVLSEGLVVQVEAAVEHNRLLSNLILLLYISIALAAIFIHYRSAKRKVFEEDTERRRQIDRLLHLERENTRSLENLLADREKLRTDLESLKVAYEKERSQAMQNEGDLIDEISLLESKLNDNTARESTWLSEIEALREKIATFEKEQRKDEKYRLKSEEEVRKRFAALYKSLSIHERAIRGFVELGEELKLRAEEVVQQLNHAPDLVPVKRKVFGKKNRETVLEVVFAYKGRLYFRKGADRRVEVLAIGTKNTQARELEFLSSL